MPAHHSEGQAHSFFHFPYGGTVLHRSFFDLAFRRFVPVAQSRSRWASLVVEQASLTLTSLSLNGNIRPWLFFQDQRCGDQGKTWSSKSHLVNDFARFTVLYPIPCTLLLFTKVHLLRERVGQRLLYSVLSFVP